MRQGVWSLRPFSGLSSASSLQAGQATLGSATLGSTSLTTTHHVAVTTCSIPPCVFGCREDF